MTIPISAIPCTNKKLAVLGVAFKPDTDDITEAPALRVIDSLIIEQAQVKIYDPVATLPDDYPNQAVTVCLDAEEALQDANAVILCTERPIFKTIDWADMKRLMHQPNIFDGRNMLWSWLRWFAACHEFHCERIFRHRNHTDERKLGTLETGLFRMYPTMSSSKESRQDS
jgi:UDP-N-acetyl-D-mannosaminuronate dehydrogenase